MNKKHNPIILTSSLLQSESCTKSKEDQGNTLSHKYVKRTKNNYNFSYFNKKEPNFNIQNLTNEEIEKLKEEIKKLNEKIEETRQEVETAETTKLKTEIERYFYNA